MGGTSADIDHRSPSALAGNETNDDALPDDYHWESGPNAGYGFGGGPVRTVGDPNAKYLKTITEHRTSIHNFLRDINPETGYLD